MDYLLRLGRDDEDADYFTIQEPKLTELCKQLAAGRGVFLHIRHAGASQHEYVRLLPPDPRAHIVYQRPVAASGSYVVSGGEVLSVSDRWIHLQEHTHV